MAVTASNMLLEPMTVTFNSVDLGGTVGGVEVSIAHEGLPLNADQWYGMPRGELQTNIQVEVSMTLSELTAATWQDVMAFVGDTHTPSMGTAVEGFGTSKLGTDVFTSAAQLKLKPVGAANDARNLTFHKAIPIPESISYSGTDLSTMSLTFRCIPDATLDTSISVFCFGDGTQTLT